MIINPPTYNPVSDSVLNFSRYRKIDVKWKEILTNNISIADYLKDYFSSFMGNSATEETLLKDCKGSYWEYLKLPANPTTGDGEKNIFCLIQSPTNRYFALTNNLGLMDENILGNVLDLSIGEFWKKLNDIHQLGVKAVLLDDKSMIEDSGFQNAEYYSRELLFCKTKFDILISKLNFIKIINSRLDGSYIDADKKERNFLKEVIEAKEDFQAIWNNGEVLESLLQTYSDFKKIEADIITELTIIQSKMLTKGYYFHFGPQGNVTVQSVNGDVETGKVYSFIKFIVEKKGKPIYKTTQPNYGDDFTHWTPQQKKTGWTPTKMPKELIGYEPSEFEKIEKLQLVEDFEDPIDSAIINFKIKKKNVCVLENFNGTFIADNGDSLKDILTQCEFSEERRRDTIIVIKNYDWIDGKKKAVTGATFYYNPLSEIVPSRLPTFGFLEVLDYRMSWDGLQLGKLLTSVNLAPGEAKSIQFSSKYAKTNSSGNSSRSFTEINITNSADTLTEFEKEASKELNTSSESSSSVSAGGSYGGASASGSTSSRSAESLKTFTRDMNKVANKVANTLSKKAALEINVSSSSSIESSYNSSNSSTITNINQGRTLNLYYYQLNNKFNGRLFIENISIQIGNSRETLEGSGIYDSVTVKLTDIVQLLQLSGEALSHEYFNYTPDSFQDSLLNSILNTFNEYTDKPLLNQTETEELSASINSVKAIQISQNIKEVFSGVNPSGEELLQKYKQLMSSLDFDNLFIRDSEQTIVVDSGSFYLDSIVGVSPATEQYSETMRELESQKIAAQIDQQQMTNRESQAKVRLLNSDAVFITRITNFSKDSTPAGNTSINMSYFSVIDVSKSIKDGNWEVYYAGEFMKNINVTVQSGGMSLTVKWIAKMPTEKELEANLVLINEPTILKFI